MHDLDHTMLEIEDDFETDDYDEFEVADGGYLDEGPFDEAEEMELASELLSVENDEELEYFLGSLIKKAIRTVRKVAKSPIIRAVARAARPFVKKALPWAARAAGGFFGGPAGALIGGKLGSFAAKRLEIDITGLTQDELEFEVARKMVRIVGNAATTAASAPSTASPAAVASSAIKSAIKKTAPRLASGGFSSSGSGARSGRWVRRGHKLVVLGV